MRRVSQIKTAVFKFLRAAMAFLVIAATVLSVAYLLQAKPVVAAPPVVSIQRISVPSAEGNSGSESPSISADGRYVVFESSASNLVTGDGNGADDVFVRDRWTGEITRVSVDSDGNEGNNTSAAPSISADGRYVAFESSATNLVAGDGNGAYDVFVHDRQTGQTTRVSVTSDNAEANSLSWAASISADGRCVAFESLAGNMVTADSNGVSDVFVRDWQAGTTTRASVAYNGAEANNKSSSASISADGRYVAFESDATNLVASDGNGASDVFVRDLSPGGTTTRVSVRSDGAEGNDGSSGPSISGDGRYVAFQSSATNLVGDDTNTLDDVFVRDRETGQTTRASVAYNGAEGDDSSYDPLSISADGQYVAFVSDATNLVAGDANGYGDVFVRYLEPGGTTVRVSVNTAGVGGNGDSYSPAVSADGKFVAFTSDAGNLVTGDSNGASDVFVRNLQMSETERVSLGRSAQGNNDSVGASVSSDGRFAAFQSLAGNLVSGDTNGFSDIFVRDRQTGETTRVSMASDNTTQGNGLSIRPSISADGRYVAFESDASNLVASDTNSMTDIFVRDRQTGETKRASLADDESQADLNCNAPSISADGRYVAFESTATNLVGAGNDNNNSRDIFVRDLQLGVTTRVSVHTNGTEAASSAGSWDPSISADGRCIAFYSYANNLVDGDSGRCDVFVRDCQLPQTTRVSVAPGPDPQPNSDSLAPSISADGRYVAFESYASNLVIGDSNGRYDIFVYDRQAWSTARVSVASGGAQANGDSGSASISADGQRVAFQSDASNLVSSDSNSRTDIFVHERQTVTTRRLSVDSEGTQSNGHSYLPTMTSDGGHVVFESEASNLVADDGNGYQDVFVASWENPSLTYTPASIDFGARYQNSSASQTLQVLNAGTGTLPYTLSENSTWCSITPSVGDSAGETDNLTVAIDTTGLSPGSYSCVMLITSDAGVGIVPVHLTVQPTPAMVVAPTGRDFGTVTIGGSSDQVFTVSNTGTGNLVIGSVAAANPLAAPFSIVSDNCSGHTVLPGDNCTMTVRYSPTVKGSFSDSFDIPSNDPDAASVTVTLSGVTPNVAPTAPVVDVTPDNPDTTVNLVCSITTQSTDADGDGINYTYQWYKDTVLQPALTTSTVSAAETAKGQAWKCVVTPGDGIDNGPSAEDQVTIRNSAPAAAVVAITPDSPGTAADLVCNVTTPSPDADNDLIIYSYQWYKDDLLQSGLTTNTVGAAETTRGQVWKCVVTPSDGTAGGPTAEDQVTIQNTTATAPVVDVTPDSPDTTADLVCTITTPSTDADGDNITYSYQWYRDDAPQSALTTNTVGAAETSKGQVWKCVVSSSDGIASGSSAEDRVTIQNSTPTAPVVTVTPESPDASADLVCTITTQSSDADGDTITYIYQWYKDGEVQTALTTDTVSAAETAKGQIWKCVVTASDGTANGPTAQTEVTVTGSAGGVPAGGIAGIVVGVLVVMGAAAFLSYRYSRRRRAF